MGVKVRKKLNSSGTYSLYLDICHNSKRYKEYLNGFLLKNTNKVEDKKADKEVIAIVHQLAHKRALELASEGLEILKERKLDIDVEEYFAQFVAKYEKSDIRNVKGAINKFLCFLKSRKIKGLTLKGLDEKLVYNYVQYLDAVCRGEGASSYYKRFKKIIKNAVRDKYLKTDPCIGITVKKREGIIKDTLTPEELQYLYNSPANNDNVKNAFLFASFTGLAWVDIKELKWSHLDLVNMILKKPRKKTGVWTIVPLHETLLNLIPEFEGDFEGNVFVLPSHTSALKTLKKWVAGTGINKHITFHCGRHGTATNLINNGVDVTIVAKILGHASLKHTMRYLHIAEQKKKDAVNTLPHLHGK